jgi:hypothetical protein
VADGEEGGGGHGRMVIGPLGNGKGGRFSIFD